MSAAVVWLLVCGALGVLALIAPPADRAMVAGMFVVAAVFTGLVSTMVSVGAAVLS